VKVGNLQKSEDFSVLLLDAPDAVRMLFDPPAAEFGRSRKWPPFRGRKGRVVRDFRSVAACGFLRPSDVDSGGGTLKALLALRVACFRMTLPHSFECRFLVLMEKAIFLRRNEKGACAVLEIGV